MAQNLDPQPALLYPKSGTLYLHDRLHNANVDIVNLIDTLVLRDQTIAHLEERIRQLEASNNVVTMVPAAD